MFLGTVRGKAAWIMRLWMIDAHWTVPGGPYSIATVFYLLFYKESLFKTIFLPSDTSTTMEVWNFTRRLLLRVMWRHPVCSNQPRHTRNNHSGWSLVQVNDFYAASVHWCDVIQFAQTSRGIHATTTAAGHQSRWMIFTRRLRINVTSSSADTDPYQNVTDPEHCY